MEVGRTEEGGVCGGSSQSNVQTRLDVTRLEEYWTKLLDTIDKTITEKCGNTRGVTYERNEACGGQNRFRVYTKTRPRRRKLYQEANKKQQIGQWEQRETKQQLEEWT